MNMPLNASFRHPNDPVEQARYNMVEQQIRPWNVFDAEILTLLREALLAHRAAQVVTLEIVPELAEMARENLASAGIQNAAVRLADGTDRIPDGPFDVIVLSGSVAALPPALLAQLRDGGRLMGIVGNEPAMRATLVQRLGDRFLTTQPWDTNAARLVSFPEPSLFKF